METQNLTIALLMDTENISPKYMEALERELIVLGKVSYKRMFGDFTKQQAEGWKKIVNDFSITPIQQFTYTKGKNATDSKIIIDARDILYSGNVNAFCLLTSDSDFTGLAKRLKESNIFVIGAGERKTSASFIKSCDRFFVLEDLMEKDIKPAKEIIEKTDAKKAKPKKPLISKKSSIEDKADELVVTVKEISELTQALLESMDGKPCTISYVMQKVYQRYPQFNIKQFGVRKAKDIFDKDKFEIIDRDATDSLITLKF